MVRISVNGFGYTESVLFNGSAVASAPRFITPKGEKLLMPVPVMVYGLEPLTAPEFSAVQAPPV